VLGYFFINVMMQRALRRREAAQSPWRAGSKH